MRAPLGLALFAGAWLACPVALHAQAAEEQSYDIPARPLADAIGQFASRAQVSVAFDAETVARRFSSPIRGRFTPQIALQRLLTGTGLISRFTAPRSAIVLDPGGGPVGTANGSREGGGAVQRPVVRLDLATVRAPRIVGTRNPAALNAYAQHAASEIQALFGREAEYQDNFRLRLAVSIDAEGRVSQVVLLRATGRARRDAQVNALVLGHPIGIPPADLVQPLTFEITGQHAAKRRDARP
jgi:hypothetical protein